MKATTPYERGQSAARRGKLMRDNPYTHATSHQSRCFWDWQRGYVEQTMTEAASAKAEPQKRLRPAGFHRISQEEFAVTPTKFFEYHQNNSGGSFDIEDGRGVGVNVWIEAVDASHADSRAESLGIYFDGCASGMDCDCCGDRWSTAWGDGEAAPKINPEYDFNWHDTIYVHRLDNSIERIIAPKDAQ